MSDKRRCVLHIGTMKTGTSTIQAWLMKHRQQLEAQNWAYPGWPLRSADRIARTVAKLAPTTNLVISDEGLWHFSGSPRSDTKEIAALLANFDVTVILYLRRPDEYLEAWFKQGLKNGRGQHDISRFLATPTTQARDMRSRLNQFARIFGEERLIVAPYERSQMRGGDLITDFLERTGLPAVESGSETDSSATLKENVSPAADVMLVAGLMRQVFHVDQGLIDSLLAARQDASIVDRRRSLLTDKEAAAIKSDYRPLFREIHERFGAGVAPDFFVDWGDDKAHPPLCLMRQTYDQYMQLIGSGEPPSPPPASQAK